MIRASKRSSAAGYARRFNPRQSTSLRETLLHLGRTRTHIASICMAQHDCKSLRLRHVISRLRFAKPLWDQKFYRGFESPHSPPFT